MSTLLATTSLSDKAREREVETTGHDPGEFVYRLHKPTCDRLGAARATGTLVEVEGHAAEYADQILAASACTRCKPRSVETLKAEAEDAVANEAPVPEPEQPAPTPSDPAPTRGAAPVLAGPPAQRHPVDGRVLGLTSARYPEVEPGVSLYCAGCGEEHPAQRFAYLVKKGSGDGRPVVCRKSDTARIEANKAAREQGQPPTPAPRLDPEHVVQKEARA